MSKQKYIDKGPDHVSTNDIGHDQVQLTTFEIVSEKTDNLSCHLLYNTL